MVDVYYRDTKKAMDALEEEEFSFLNQDLQDCIELVVTEVGGLLEEYEEKENWVEALTQLLIDNDIPVPDSI